MSLEAPLSMIRAAHYPLCGGKIKCFKRSVSYMAGFRRPEELGRVFIMHYLFGKDTIKSQLVRGRRLGDRDTLYGLLPLKEHKFKSQQDVELPAPVIL